MGARSHTFLNEGGGISTLGGVHSCQLMEQADGSLALGDVEAALRDPRDDHQPVTRLIEIENTHNRCGGTNPVPAYIRQLPISLTPATWLSTWMALASSIRLSRRGWT